MSSKAAPTVSELKDIERLVKRCISDTEEGLKNLAADRWKQIRTLVKGVPR